MPVAETWLLPDGVADILPAEAHTIESLRRRLLHTLSLRGYALVYTPFIEYVESLLTHNQGKNHDMDLATFKLIDQLTGRLMGVRADITPQVARIDAHVNPVEGVARYCYAATVLHTRPQGLSASRTPLQLGAELFGHGGLAADLEMIDVMLTVLADAGLQQKLHLDLGHVAVFRALAQSAGLTDEQENTLFDIYQRKSMPELKAICTDLPQGSDFLALGRHGNDLPTLTQVFSKTARDNAAVQHALDQLATTLAHVQAHWPEVDVSVDATELRSYHYHTGLVFAVYAPNQATPLAKGGRYDGVGQAFGRARPATGFSCDLYAISGYQSAETPIVVAAPAGRDVRLQAAITDARTVGHIVIQALGFDHTDPSGNEHATHQLTEVDGRWQIVTKQV